MADPPPTRPEEISFEPKGKKLKSLTFSKEIFQIQTQTISGWHDRVKFFWPRSITTLSQLTKRISEKLIGKRLAELKWFRIIMIIYILWSDLNIFKNMQIHINNMGENEKSFYLRGFVIPLKCFVRHLIVRFH